jgi:hypothetical protein
VINFPETVDIIILKKMNLGVKIDQKSSKMAIEKNRRFVIFRVHFYRFLTILGPIGIYRKTAPTKSPVLGPDPPPGNFYKFIDFLWFFWILGPSIEPEKASVKSASTPYPPPKSGFYSVLLKLGGKIYRPLRF